MRFLDWCLAKGKVGDLFSPQFFHAPKVQVFKEQNIKRTTQVYRKFPMITCKAIATVRLLEEDGTILGELVWRMVSGHNIEITEFGVFEEPNVLISLKLAFENVLKTPRIRNIPMLVLRKFLELVKCLDILPYERFLPYLR